MCTRARMCNNTPVRVSHVPHLRGRACSSCCGRRRAAAASREIPGASPTRNARAQFGSIAIARAVNIVRARARALFDASVRTLARARACSVLRDRASTSASAAAKSVSRFKRALFRLNWCDGRACARARSICRCGHAAFIYARHSDDLEHAPNETRSPGAPRSSGSPNEDGIVGTRFLGKIIIIEAHRDVCPCVCCLTMHNPWKL